MRALAETTMFWFAFLVPGFALARALGILPRLAAPGAVGFSVVLAYLLGTSLLAPVVLAAYVFRWSVTPVVYGFWVLVIGGVAVLAMPGVKRGKAFLPSLPRPRLDVLAAIFVLLLVFDFAVAARVGNPPRDDGGFHLAKIQQTLLEGPSPVDPLYGEVSESRYHYSVQHVLYALAARSTGLPVTDVWKLSASFFRLLWWLAGFALIAEFFPRRYLRYGLFVGYFVVLYDFNFHPGYPNASQSFVLFVAALLLLLRLARERAPRVSDVGARSLVEPPGGNGRNAAVLGLALFVLGFSHASYAAGVVVFLTLVAVACLVFGWIRPRTVAQVAPWALASLGFPLYSFLQPDHMLASSRAFGLKDTDFVDLFHGRLLAVEFNGGVLDTRLLLVLAGLCLAALVIAERPRRFLLLAAFLWPVLILNTPFFLSWLMDIVPFWLIRRVKFVDVFSPILGILPVVYGLDFLTRRFGFVLGRRTAQAVFVTVLALALLPAFSNVAQFWERRAAHAAAYAQLEELASFAPAIVPGRLLLAEPATSYMIPGALGLKVLSIQNLDNANPAQPDLEERARDLDRFLTDGLRPETVARYLTTPTYVLLPQGSQLSAAERERLVLRATSPSYCLYVLNVREGKKVP